MTLLKDKLVLVTGGASGIGRIMGRMALERGARLVIWDKDKERGEKTRKEISAFGEVYFYNVDVSSPSDVKYSAKLVKQKFGGIDVLINNAGVVTGKYFHQHTREEIEKTINVNTTASMYVTREFLSGMIENNEGHICNISSMAGLIGNPRMPVYVASKWALVGWSDTLRLEMRKLAKNVKVTTVTPFYIDTGMFAGVRTFYPVLKPEGVARKVIRAIERNRILVSMPWSVRFVRFCQGIMPIRFFDWFMGDVLRVYQTMDHFQGRDKSVKNGGT